MKVKLRLDVRDNAGGCCCVGNGGGFVRCECVGACERKEEEVVLDHVMLEGLLWECAVRELSDEGMVHVSVPEGCDARMVKQVVNEVVRGEREGVGGVEVVDWA